MDKAHVLRILGKKKYRAYDTKRKRLFIVDRIVKNDELILSSPETGETIRIKHSCSLQLMELIVSDRNNEEVYELDIVLSNKFKSPLIISIVDNVIGAQFLFNDHPYSEGDFLTIRELGSFVKNGNVFEIKKIMADYLKTHS